MTAAAGGNDFVWTLPADRHRVIRRTAKRIYVAFAGKQHWGKPAATVILEREWFERDEEYYHSTLGETFYAKPLEGPPARYREQLEDLIRDKRARWQQERLDARLCDAAKSIVKLLGLPSTATPSEIRRAYHRRARELHPDVGGSSTAFSELSAAYAATKGEI